MQIMTPVHHATVASYRKDHRHGSTSIAPQGHLHSAAWCLKSSAKLAGAGQHELSTLPAGLFWRLEIEASVSTI